MMRMFQGHTTRQVDVLGRPAVQRHWYYEPVDYDGDVLWSTGYTTYAAARQAALQEEALLADNDEDAPDEARP